MRLRANNNDVFCIACETLCIEIKGMEIMGLLERVAVYTFQVWSVVLAVLLIKE